ncbi:unnamed protein product [Closterium sp. NIES-65]|nr:unnamed protein product [Closterium sp. NIES-65]
MTALSQCGQGHSHSAGHCHSAVTATPPLPAPPLWTSLELLSTVIPSSLCFQHRGCGVRVHQGEVVFVNEHGLMGWGEAARRREHEGTGREKGKIEGGSAGIDVVMGEDEDGEGNREEQNNGDEEGSKGTKEEAHVGDESRWLRGGSDGLLAAIRRCHPSMAARYLAGVQAMTASYMSTIAGFSMGLSDLGNAVREMVEAGSLGSAKVIAQQAQPQALLLLVPLLTSLPGA